MKNRDTAWTGSSETTREASVFNFDNVLFETTPNSSGVENLTPFFEWFLGFVEGDGSFVVRKFTTTKNPTATRPYFVINQKDPKVLYTIKKRLGFGTIIKVAKTEKQNAYHRYAVSKLRHIEWLVHLFNGNLLLTKVHARFVKWVECFNSLCLAPDVALEKEMGRAPVHIKPFFKEAAHRVSLNSGWLAGFVDAEGGFYGSLAKNNRFATGYRDRWKFYISQKNERWLLCRIGELVEEATWKKAGFVSKPASWGEKNNAIELKQRSNTYRCEILRIDSLKVLIDYFDRWPLLSKQRLVFVRWKRCILGRDGHKAAALKSEKGMRRYLRRFESIGKIRQVAGKNDPDAERSMA